MLLADAEGKPDVLHALHHHFEPLADTDEWLLVQGTVIMHVQFAVKQDQQLGSAVLRQVKQGTLPLGRFTVALLLSLARVGNAFHRAILDYLRSTVKEAFELRQWAASSPWLAKAAGSLFALKPETLLATAVRTSSTASFDHLVPSLIDFAAALLDEPPPSARGPKANASAASGASAIAADDDEGGGGGDAAGDGAAAGGVAGGSDGGFGSSSSRLAPVPVRMARLGRSALIELFRLHEMVRPTVIDMIIDRLIGRGPAAANWVGALDELVLMQPLAVLGHTQRIKQLLEYVLALPPATATAMLSSLLPLQRQRPELRDHLVLLLRKAMFSREEPTRLTAVHGFLLLLHTTTPSGSGGAGGGGGGSSASAGAPIGMDGAPLADENVLFQLELLGFIRRSLTQQASIRAALYDGIVPAFAAQPHLRGMVLELLMKQLDLYTDLYEESDDGEGGVGGAGAPSTVGTSVNATLPIKIDRCLSFSRDGSAPPSLVEPLPQLIRAITRCVLAARVTGGSGGGSGGGGGGVTSSSNEETELALRGVLTRMRRMVDRMAVCGLRQLSLSSDGVLQAKDKNGAYHWAVATFMDATLEALLDHTLLCHVGGAAGARPDDAGGEGGGDAEDGGIMMATQAAAGESSTQAPFGNVDPAIEAARRLFVLGLNLRELLLNAKWRVNGKVKPQPLAPWLRVDLSLGACSRVLSALLAEAGVGGHAAGFGLTQAAAKSSTSRRFARHVLKAITARTSALGVGVDASAAAPPPSSAAPSTSALSGAQFSWASSFRGEMVEGTCHVLTALLRLIPSCEGEEMGKEAPSGIRGRVNPLTGRLNAKGESGEGGGKGGGKAGSSTDAAKEPKVKSRLHLLLESVDACLSLLCTRAPHSALAAALRPIAAQPAVGAGAQGVETSEAVVPEDEEEGEENHLLESDDDDSPAVSRRLAFVDTPGGAETGAVAGVATAGASGSGSPSLSSVVVRALMQCVVPLVQRCVETESYVEAEAALKIATRLTGCVPPTALSAALKWSASDACVGNAAVCWHSTARQLLAFHLSLARKANPDGAPLAAVARRILWALGDNMNEEEEMAEDTDDELCGRSVKFDLITEGAAQALTPALLDGVNTELTDLERALVVLKRQPGFSANSASSSKADGARASSAKAEPEAALEAALLAGERRVLGALRLLCKAQLEAGAAQPILARCARLFKHQTAALRWFTAAGLATSSSAAQQQMLARAAKAHAPLISELCGEESLCSAMYGLISFVGSCEAPARAGSKAEVAAAKKKAQAQAKLIPELVFVVDKFEAAVVTLSAKSRDDSLLMLMKKATARDFRIQVSEVASKLKKLDHAKQKGEAEAREKAEKKRKREQEKLDKEARKASKAAGGGGKGKNKGTGKKDGDAGASTKSNAPAVVEEDGDEEEEDDDEEEAVAEMEEDAGEEGGEEDIEEGEEDEDAYPASMIGDDEEEEEEE